MSQNALFADPKPEVDEVEADGPGGWHVDHLVKFPLPPDVSRQDPRMPLPWRQRMLGRHRKGPYG